MDQELLIQEIEPSSSKKILGIPNDDLLKVQPSNILAKYNLFIECYNKACNRVDEKTLSFMQESKLFISLNFIFSKPSLTALLIISFVVPFLGILLIFYVGMAVYYYFKALRIFRKNQKRVKDPFKNMKFDHVKCSKLKKNFHFITINFKNLNSEFNFKENVELTQSQRKSGQNSEWMIYNEVFASYYSDFPKYRTKLIILLLMAILFSFTSMIVFLLLI